MGRETKGGGKRKNPPIRDAIKLLSEQEQGRKKEIHSTVKGVEIHPTLIVNKGENYSPLRRTERRKKEKNSCSHIAPAEKGGRPTEERRRRGRALGLPAWTASGEGYDGLPHSSCSPKEPGVPHP